MHSAQFCRGASDLYTLSLMVLQLLQLQFKGTVAHVILYLIHRVVITGNR